jgi:putative ABC transport system permease protein
VLLALLLLGVGATDSILTVTVNGHTDDPFAAMTTAGPASVFWSLGLAVLAAPLLRLTARLLGPLLAPGSVAGYLARSNIARRSHQSAAALAPVIVFVGISTGTLYLMAVQNAAGAPDDPQSRSVALLNYVVVSMIAVFAAIMVVNTLVTVVSQRRQEFAAQRLGGAGGRQLIAVVGFEAALISVAGIVIGGLASLGTVIPFTIARTDRWLPDTGPGVYAGVSAVALVVTLVTALLVARRAVRAPVLDAVAAL